MDEEAVREAGETVKGEGETVNEDCQMKRKTVKGK